METITESDESPEPAPVPARRRWHYINPTHDGATYQLATAPDRAGKPAEARPLWETVLPMGEAYRDQQSADLARARLAQRP